MRVLVAGATGVIGRTLVPMLISAGHSVVGMVRSPEGLVRVAELGSEPVRADILDADAVRKAVETAQPDAIVSLATSIPHSMRIEPRDWTMNDRVRVEGTANLIASADSSLRLMVLQSVGLLYEPQNGRWIDETSPDRQIPFLRATQEMEQIGKRSGLPTTILRASALIAPASWHTQQCIASLKRGMLPIVGDGSAYISHIHVADYASCIMAALENPEKSAGNTFIVSEEQPAPTAEVMPYIARLIGAPAPARVPAMLAKLAVGALTLEIFAASYRFSSARAREILGWKPHFPSYREIWADVVAAHD